MRFASRLPKSSIHRTVALLALLIATAPALARAQVTTTGIIRVAVTDQGDLPIPGATVTAGGIPAEYVGAPGLLSSVITKSGTNRLSGSVNYFFQNDGLVAENRNASDQEFSRFDTALTGGGPIVTDEAWFFGHDPTEVSGSRDRDVTNARDSSRVQGGNNYHPSTRATTETATGRSPRTSSLRA